MRIQSQDPKDVFGKAQWIWPASQGYDLVDCFAQARKTFALKSLPKRCVIKITADARYKLYVNGRYVCRGPARGYQYSWPYDEVDIAPYLVRGKNVIAVLALSYGIGTFQYICQDAGGIIISGRIAGVDISTGPSWKVRQAPGYSRTMTRLSVEMGFEEFFDARLDDGSWMLRSCNDSKWLAPRLAAAGAMPWHTVEPRGIPLLREDMVAPVALTAECAGTCAPDWRTAANLTALYCAEKRRWRAACRKLKRDKAQASLRAAAAGAGRFRAYLVDFGREVVGSVGLEVSGASGGEVIDAQVSETITGLAPDIVHPSEGCKIAMCNRIILRKGRTRHEHFEAFGFRYLAVIVRDSSGPLTVRVNLRTAVYPLDVKGAFRSSDRMLNGIYRISVRAQESCMLDAYVDCPWREQAQWWGDARVQAANTFHLSADPRLLARGIRQTAGQGAPNGLTYGLTPTTSHHCILPDYTLTWIMTIWDYYYQTGDKSLIREYASRMLRALSYFESATADNGLLPYDDRYWLFLDWADVFKEGFPTLYNIFHYWALSTASQLFDLVNLRDEARFFAGRAARARTAIMSRLFDARTRSFFGGLDWNGRPVRQDTPHAYALAVLSGLCPQHDRFFIKEKLVPLVRGECPRFEAASTMLMGGAGERFPKEPSPFFMYYVFQALKARDRKAEVIDCVRRWYGTFVKEGFTTTPEMWGHIRGRWSACHAWSAHAIVHFHNVLLGVTQTAVGWRKIEFAPVFEKLSFAEGKVATPLGVVEAAWRRGAEKIEVTLSLPKGVTARVRLPGVRKTATAGRHRWVLKGPR